VNGNKVVAYDRADDGTLSLAGTYDTGGVGATLAGSVVDRTASQGALAIDAERGVLYAVNAGSDTVSVFSVRGSALHLRQIVPSGGSFPSSIAVHGNLVEVLNSRGGGSIRGFRVDDGRLHRIAGSDRALGLDPAATPEFVNTPGQVTFTPDGSQVLVTTKANTHAIESFAVGRGGRLSATPVVTTFPGTVPFALTFDRAGHAVVAVAGSNAVVTATVNADGTLTQIESDPTGQAATCWIVRVGDRVYASNAGSGSLTGFNGDEAGHLTLIGNTHTDAGSVDAAATSDGRFIYVQAGLAGNVDEFSVNADGSLTAIGSVTVADAVGGEGIVTL
jgi:6-phosphogluconolactonase (cycloisomerase 2 family)